MLTKNLMALSNSLGTYAMWISAALLCYIVIHINIEIFFRTFLDTSTFSMDEFVGYAIGAMTFLSLSHTFQNRKHIRVSILQSVIRGRVAIFVELICIACTFGITLFLARFIFRTLSRDFNRGTVSPTLTETPIWLIDGAIFVGLVLFLLQLFTIALCIIVHGIPDERLKRD
tara:strand:- start:94 stop:609 length:516 start_codon:yes stop_codon:yes gene_type:complete